MIIFKSIIIPGALGKAYGHAVRVGVTVRAPAGTVGLHCAALYLFNTSRASAAGGGGGKRAAAAPDRLPRPHRPIVRAGRWVALPRHGQPSAAAGKGGSAPEGGGRATVRWGDAGV